MIRECFLRHIIHLAVSQVFTFNYHISMFLLKKKKNMQNNYQQVNINDSLYAVCRAEWEQKYFGVPVNVLTLHKKDKCKTCPVERDCRQQSKIVVS